MKNITHCKHGHEFTPENTLRNKKTGYRFCRICHNAASAKRDTQYIKDYNAKRKAAGWKRDYKSEPGYALLVERATLWNKENKDRRRKQPCNSSERNRQLRYGLTPERYKIMYHEQGGMCALQFCDRPIQCVDHCHITEQVRGLLCRRCNVALGMLNENPLLMIRAAEYVTAARLDYDISMMNAPKIVEAI